MEKILSDVAISEFIEKGYIKLDNAFPVELAEKGRSILWKDTGCDPNDKSTWIHPVIRLGDYPQEPFRLAVNTPQLYAAFDQLVGKGRWMPRYSLGTFPIRFPNPNDPGDAGWHAEASFQGEDGSWRLNVMSTGRALLMLFLFSDVEPEDAPTRILVGSHLDVPSLLYSAGKNGLSFIELAERFTPSILDRPIEFATGKAGTVFLCHPFLVHAAQPHRGYHPRFMAQPPLCPSEPFNFNRADGNYSPVELSILAGLEIGKR